MGKTNAEKYMQYAICVKKKKKGKSMLSACACCAQKSLEDASETGITVRLFGGGLVSYNSLRVRETSVPFRPHPPRTEPDLRPLVAGAGSAWEGAGLRAQPISHLVVWGHHTNH